MNLTRITAFLFLFSLLSSTADALAATTTKRAAIQARLASTSTLSSSIPAPGPFWLPSSTAADWVISSYTAIVSNPTLSLRSGDPRGITSAYIATPVTNSGGMMKSAKFEFHYVSGYKLGSVSTNFTVYLENMVNGNQILLMSSGSLSAYSYDDCQSCYSPTVTLTSPPLSLIVTEPHRVRLVFYNNDRNIQLRLADSLFTYYYAPTSPEPTLPPYTNTVSWGPPVNTPQSWFCTAGADGVNNPVVSIRSGNPGQTSYCLSVPRKAHRVMDGYSLQLRGASGKFAYSWGFGNVAPSGVPPRLQISLVGTGSGAVVLWTSPPLNDSTVSFDKCASCYAVQSWSYSGTVGMDYSQSYYWRIDFVNNDRNLQVRLIDLQMGSNWYNMYFDG